MKYAYEDLSDTQFENLVVLLCQRLLGISVQGFSKVPDGGRDAKFVGTAELHPSKAAPWRDHHHSSRTQLMDITAFSLTDFFSTVNSSTVLGEELHVLRNCALTSNWTTICYLPIGG